VRRRGGWFLRRDAQRWAGLTVVASGATGPDFLICTCVRHIYELSCG
jgi:hypothetical protein